MIIDASQRDLLPGRFALVDGCFDPLHRGHVEYFKFAASQGVPVLCNVAADQYIVGHKKRPPLLPEADRLALIDAMRAIDYVFLSRHGTAWSLRYFQPTYYVKGVDWRDCLPPEQVAVCAELGITIVYADCPLNSSARILETFVERRNGHQGF